MVGQKLFCPRCGQPTVAPRCGEITPVQATSLDCTIRYAGFWIRFVAALVDTAVLLIPSVVANLVVPVVGGLAAWIIYKSLCIANWDGQTVGKKACGIKVVDRTWADVR